MTEKTCGSCKYIKRGSVMFTASPAGRKTRVAGTGKKMILRRSKKNRQYATIK